MQAPSHTVGTLINIRGHTIVNFQEEGQDDGDTQSGHKETDRRKPVDVFTGLLTSFEKKHRAKEGTFHVGRALKKNVQSNNHPLRNVHKASNNTIFTNHSIISLHQPLDNSSALRPRATGNSYGSSGKRLEHSRLPLSEARSDPQ